MGKRDIGGGPVAICHSLFVSISVLLKDIHAFLLMDQMASFHLISS